MSLEFEKSGDVAVVVLPGETLQASNVNLFKQGLEPILTENAKLVFDMSHLRFIDSTGYGLFISTLKRLQKKGGGLKTCCFTAPVENLFTLMGFDKLFGIFKSREDAIRAFKK